MVESLARLSKEGADDCRFGGGISTGESRQFSNVTSHGLGSNHSTTSFRSSRIGFRTFKPLEPPTRFERFERLERLERVHVRHFVGTGTTVPQFLHVRSFSSLENFW